MKTIKKTVTVRNGLTLIKKYNGYMFYEVRDKKGHFLFGFHVLSEDADVYFSAADVSFNKKRNCVVVKET